MTYGEKVRIEKDSMGEVPVPENALYGAQTQRAVENFPISDLRLPREFIQAMGRIKLVSAKVNAELGLLEPRIADAIVEAAKEIIDGTLDAQFVVDVFQTGQAPL